MGITVLAIDDDDHDDDASQDELWVKAKNFNAGSGTYLASLNHSRAASALSSPAALTKHTLSMRCFLIMSSACSAVVASGAVTGSLRMARGGG